MHRLCILGWFAYAAKIFSETETSCAYSLLQEQTEYLHSKILSLITKLFYEEVHHVSLYLRSSWRHWRIFTRMS